MNQQLIDLAKRNKASVTEHWTVTRKRENKPIALEGNVPRMSAETMLKLNDLKNKLLGTNYSLYEAQNPSLTEEE